MQEPITSRICSSCIHYDHEHQYCGQWQRPMSPTFRMSAEHNCPHFHDFLDLDLKVSLGRK